jgi:hypothetical protein
MKKICLSVLSLVVSTTIFAQIKFAPEFGVNVAMQTNRTLSPISSMSLTESSHPAVGMSAGLNLDIKILRNLYLNTGAFYMFNNVKYSSEIAFPKEGLGSAGYERYDRVHYVRAPLYIMYKSGYEGMGRFIAGVGGYAAYAVGGNRVIASPYAAQDPVNSTYQIVYNKSNTEMTFGDDIKNDMRRWDMGLNACIGYESNIGLYFRGSVSYGLANLNPENVSEKRIRNWGVGFSIGYLIGKDNW